jgi:hypothetical protein
MTDQTYPDPFSDALGRTSQRAASLTTLSTALIREFMQYRARREAERAAADQAAAEQAARAEHEARRSVQRTWSAAHHPAFASRADLFTAARTWGAAMPYAPADPSAAAALRASEDRLRALHPYAMSHYDRLRGQGASPFQAMREALPLFARHPDPRPGQPAPARHPLDAVPPATPGPQPPATPPPAPEPEPAAGTSAQDQAEARGRQIITRLQDRARAAGRPPLGRDELVTVLEAMTTLPPDVITRLTRPGRAPAAARPAGERSPVTLAAENFPGTAADAVRAGAAAAARGGLPEPSRIVTKTPLRPAHRSR